MLTRADKAFHEAVHWMRSLPELIEHLQRQGKLKGSAVKELLEYARAAQEAAERVRMENRR
jgi:hypothetical protein